MSLRPEVIGPVPEETARVARAAFPKGNVYLRMRDVLGVVYDDVSFAPLYAARGPMIHVDFAPADCMPCPARPQCTRASGQPQSLTLQPQAEHEAIQAARQRQQTPEFAAQYASRAGVEGSLSQGVRAFGLRQARYRGLAKTHLQHAATAAAINVHRLADWLSGVAPARTRASHVAALAPAPAPCAMATGAEFANGILTGRCRTPDSEGPPDRPSPDSRHASSIGLVSPMRSPVIAYTAI